MAKASGDKSESALDRGMRAVLDKLSGAKAAVTAPPAPKDLGSGMAKQAADAIVKHKKEIDEAAKD
jgi:hypothetical protein